MTRREFIGAVALASCSCALPQRAVTLERGDFGIARRRQETALHLLVIVDENNQRLNVAGHPGRMLIELMGCGPPLLNGIIVPRRGRGSATKRETAGHQCAITDLRDMGE